MVAGSRRDQRYRFFVEERREWGGDGGTRGRGEVRDHVVKRGARRRTEANDLHGRLGSGGRWVVVLECAILKSSGNDQ